jgi:hypothetical protein
MLDEGHHARATGGKVAVTRYPADLIKPDRLSPVRGGLLGLYQGTGPMESARARVLLHSVIEELHDHQNDDGDQDQADDKQDQHRCLRRARA